MVLLCTYLYDTSTLLVTCKKGCEHAAISPHPFTVNFTRCLETFFRERGWNYVLYIIKGLSVRRKNDISNDIPTYSWKFNKYSKGDNLELEGVNDPETPFIRANVCSVSHVRWRKITINRSSYVKPN